MITVKKFKLIGVTGTNGKTSTTYILKSILENANKKVGLIGTNQNMIGQKVIKSKHTTPESLSFRLY
jgi:UDP-N-acetylmuramoyl-L-alanyl-D-glutamate--2,6-diaminopimelate ligase